MIETVMNTICLSFDGAYTRGWRLRRDRGELAPSDGAFERQGWEDADYAIKLGRDISWSRGSDGEFVLVGEKGGA